MNPQSKCSGAVGVETVLSSFQFCTKVCRRRTQTTAQGLGYPTAAAVAPDSVMLLLATLPTEAWSAHALEDRHPPADEA